jgi:enamine deaminase RidA (YjgF/YER057c/UK114 family)
MTDNVHFSPTSPGITVINPPELGKPRGFAHGVLTPPGGRVLRVGGQTASDAEGRVTAAPLTDQFARALSRVLTVVRAAGGTPEQVVRMTIYVTDMPAYRSSRAELRDIWREQMGTHYPAMSLVEVSGLVDEHAVVEIEAEAVLT